MPLDVQPGPETLADAFAEERRRLFDDFVGEGYYRFDLTEPMPIALPIEQQAERIIYGSCLAECNAGLARMYGYAQPQDLLGKRPADLFFDSDFHNESAVRAFIDAGYRAMLAETHEVDRHGKPLHILNSAFGVVRDGKLLRLWGAQRDVTPERTAEDARLMREARCSQMIDHLDQAVFLKDKDLRMAAANRRLCKNLGKNEKELIGKTDFDLFPRHLAEKYRADDLLVLTQDRKVELEEQTLIRGELRTVRVVKAPVHDSLGRTVGVLGISWDVTDQRALEAQFRHAQKMDAIGQLAAGVANEFNNMLTAVLGNLELLGKRLPDGGLERGHYEAAEAAALRAGELIGKLISFSRRVPLRLAALPLAECVLAVLEKLKPDLPPTISVETRLPAEAWLVHADAGCVQQVLLQLCLNARDAMPGGGALLIETINVRVEEDYLHGRPQARPGEFVCLQVSDTGVGVPENLRSQLFEPFVTSKAGGQNLGLGLALAYGLVERQGGWIEFQTADNLGATFSVFLPRHRAATELAPPALPPRPAPEGWGQETVLFVEDEEIIRRLGNAILTRNGLKVVLAADGHEALRLYSRNPKGFHLVVLDLSMPGLSGRDTYRRLKAFDPNVRVLFTSGQIDELEAQAQEDPAFGCISKPYRSEELARLVRAALDFGKDMPPPALPS